MRYTKNELYSRLIFISGVHASKKSSLVASLDDLQNLILLPRLKREELFNQKQFQMLVQNKGNGVDIKQRLLKRLNDCYKEFNFQLELAKLNPRYFILSDRCPLDGMAYAEACYELNWLRIGEVRELREYFQSLFQDIKQLTNGIFLEPSLQWVKQNFSERLRTEHSKPWEQKSKFIQASYYAFKKIYDAHILNTRRQWIKIKSVTLNERKQDTEDYINALNSKLI